MEVDDEMTDGVAVLTFDGGAAKKLGTGAMLDARGEASYSLSVVVWLRLQHEQ